MPFTISHAAAAIPFRRTRLVMSALVFGCFAPDMEYFLWLRPHGHFGHTLPGLLLFDLPASLVSLFFFHRYARAPLIACLPARLRGRLRKSDSASLRSVSGLALVCISVIVGSVTHLIWDSFTHTEYWVGQHWVFLRSAISLPVFGNRSWAAIFQYISSVVGLLAILVCFINWYRNSSPDHAEIERASISRDRIVVGAAFVAAVLAGIIRAGIDAMPNGIHGFQRFTTEALITGITVFCFEIIAYGFFHSRLQESSEPA